MDVGGLHQQLEAIRAEYGVLTPEVVKEAARPEDHPLHHRVFDKDVGDASEAYYTDRARHLIRLVRIKYVRRHEGFDEEVRLRAYVAPRDPERPGVYVPVEEIAADPVATQVLLQQMEREWRQFRTRWAHLGEFSELLQAYLREDAA